MTDNNPTPQPEPLTIEFGGRTMDIVIPDGGQLAMFRLVKNRMSDLVKKTEVGIYEAASVGAQGIQMVCSVLADSDDQEWIQDQVLTRKLKLGEMFKVIRLAGEAWKHAGHAEADDPAPNRAARRARPRKRTASVPPAEPE